MNTLTVNNYSLPGIRKFIKENPMFRQVEPKIADSSAEVIALADEAFLSGRLLPGDRFPSPDEISRLTGASIAESLEAVTILLESGSIEQLPSGQLTISRQAVA
ncbi:MAG: hypothetical protein ACJAVK_001114 [Akkermansiaceae bacterium]|jgi:hypothetical protein